MRRMLMFLACAVACGVLATGVLADEEPNLKGVKCVVNGKGDAKPTSWTEYKGGKVYFCCDGCKGNFTKESKKFAASANAQLVATKQAKQVKCPLMGKDVKPGVTAKIGDIEIGLCCAGCQKKVAELEGKEQVEAVFGEQAFAKGFELAKKGE